MNRLLTLGLGLALAVTTLWYVLFPKVSRPADPFPSSASEASSPASVQAVWVNYVEMEALCKEGTADAFRAKVDTLLDQCVCLGLNGVVVHVRSHSDAFYPSELFPWSAQITGTQGEGVDFDPLGIFLEAAHQKGLSFHAWINPYRVQSGSGDTNSLCESNPAKIWWNDPETQSRVVCRSDGIYYDPSSPEVRKLIIDGVREILERYPVDGIHFDDYFYPTESPDFDAKAYQAYQEEVGASALPLAEWRRTQVNLMVSGVYSAVKQTRPEALFGISPQASVAKNQSSAFADVERWASKAGYVDYLCPQLYFGFQHPLPEVRFDTLWQTWRQLVTCPSVSLWVGLAPYKLGTTDGGSSEWVDTTDLLARQVSHLQESGGCDGIVFYNAATLFADTPGATAERHSLEEKFKE